MEIQVVDYQAPSAAQSFSESLHQIGFAVLKNHPIDPQHIDQLYQQWGEFFQSEEKHQYAFDNTNHDGYVSTELSETAKGHQKKDLKEFFHYYSWGRCPEQLRPITDTLAAELTNMAANLLQWLEDAAPLAVKANFTEPLSQMIQGSDRTLFRLIHYPPLSGDETPGALRAAPHEDINFLTLLPAATAKGLQVKNSDGVWLDVPCDPGWIIVNTGDMLQELTQHYYPATTHQVVNPADGAVNKSRLSMPLFLHPRGEVKLSQRYPTAEAYLLERYAELGLD